ncbi:M15 family metallopeptidase [Burkholderia ubonensis]|uniref:M15 family metallopeptidase n=1 Tax=Burkholderia ubonensis TaxID=101571 RepID=UPI000A6DA8DE
MRIQKFLLVLLGSAAISCSGTESSTTSGVNPITPSQCADMIASSVISNNAPVKCDRLRSVVFRYVDFQGQPNTGEIIVLDAVAQRTKIIFDMLYERKFPLNKAVPMEHYRGNDNASMNDNNTSAFNARPITGGSEWSMHAYGVAIDINPRQNPYISFGEGGVATVLPAPAAKEAMNRLNYRPGKNFRPGQAEDVVDIFANNGFFQWGGYWDYPIDYQHFEVASRTFASRLASVSPVDAQRIFERGINAYVACIAEPTAGPHSAARAACVEKITRNIGQQ